MPHDLQRTKSRPKWLTSQFLNYSWVKVCFVMQLMVLYGHPVFLLKWGLMILVKCFITCDALVNYHVPDMKVIHLDRASVYNNMGAVALRLETRKRVAYCKAVLKCATNSWKCTGYYVISFQGTDYPYLGQLNYTTHTHTREMRLMPALLTQNI